MKKLGLSGGTGPESTVIYYKELNRRILEATNGKAFPELAIESINMYRALDLIEKDRPEELTDYLLAGIRNLEAGGADFVALTSVTMHFVYNRLAPLVKVPFISIPDTAAEAALQKGYRKVGLLGTIFTMEGDYLKEAFEKRGIEVIVPDGKERTLVNDRIAKELEFGLVKEETVQELVSVIDRMKAEQGIEAVILGCTELPLALNETVCGMDCLDVMALHIERLAELIMEEE